MRTLYPVALEAEALQICPTPFHSAFEDDIVIVVILKVIIYIECRLNATDRIIPAVVLKDHHPDLVQRIGWVESGGIHPELDPLMGMGQLVVDGGQQLALDIYF